YKGLMRPINLRAQRFNQQLCDGSIILEVGTNGNTIDEAKQGAKLFSEVLIKVLSENN
ncbi:MAG: stage II sporulation protein P, partial [Clostridia bacterium]|nr:stage II sporulation protein P [Clostridia bacterium]